MSIEKLIQIAFALEVDPLELFSDVLNIYRQEKAKDDNV